MVLKRLDLVAIEHLFVRSAHDLLYTITKLPDFFPGYIRRLLHAADRGFIYTNAVSTVYTRYGIKTYVTLLPTE